MKFSHVASVALMATSTTICAAPTTGRVTPALQQTSISAPEASATRSRLALKPFWSKRLTGYLKTRDGENLRYSVLLPKGKGPFPVLMIYSGYDAGAIGGSAYLAGKTTYPRSADKAFLDAGYAIIGVNARSTGCSSGKTFDWHRPLYGQDGYDAVEFAAGQPWSNGRVGMFSWSWAGMSQLWTASFQPPHLKAIAPGHVIADPRAD